MRKDGRNLVELHGMVICLLEHEGVKLEHVAEEMTSDTYTVWIGPQDLPAGWCPCICTSNPEPCDKCMAKRMPDSGL